jgi:tetratricopeptide (TPR) repeat protein
MMLGAAFAPAEVIHLKNGRTIWADHVRENGPRVEYDLGDNSYAIPKSSVERIEAGGVPPQYAVPTPAKRDVPVFFPQGQMKDDPAISGKVVQDGKIDAGELFALEKQGGPAAASGYFFAGKHEFDRGNFAKAGEYFESALRFDGQNAAILDYYAVTLARTGNPGQALPYAERAVQADPDSADAYGVLGYVQFAADRTSEAIRSWKRALEIRPDDSIKQLLAKAEREASAEADFSQRESAHFTLHYEGKQTSESFRRELIATLESDFSDLSSQLGSAPRANIPVVIYTGQAFFDVTQAPSWTGAINDGKLRIPVEGLTSVTPELARVLKHELSHSFINYLSHGRCPQWLHEGIAQSLEPKSLSSSGRRLAQLFAAQHAIPFNMLEESFMRYSPGEAVLAYDESLAAVDYVEETYGMDHIQRILERIGEGSSTEAALRATIHSDYGQLEAEVGKYLAGKYGE